MSRNLAVYTTIYPGVELFLADWYGSLCRQTDGDYQLWIGLDSVSPEAARAAMRGDLDAIWISGDAGDTPAQVRQKVLARIVEMHDGVVLVDSDDVLHESRISAARAALQASDVAACALRVVDRGGRDLGLTLALPPGVEPDDLLPRNNLFGLSNSAFRCDLLRRCLPIPASTVLVDWFLATRAWLCGARLVFDPEVRMDYRQHGANTAHVVPPFSAPQVARDTQLVRRHLRVVQESLVKESVPSRVAALEQMAADVEAFYWSIVLVPGRLDRYTEVLNTLDIAPMWWSCVAHPALRHMWRAGREMPWKPLA